MISYLNHGWLRSVWLNDQAVGDFLVIFSLLISSLMTLQSEDILWIILILWKLWSFSLWATVWSILANVSRSFIQVKKKIHSVFVGCDALYMSIRSIWLICCIGSSISWQIILSACSISYWEICLNVPHYDGCAFVTFPFSYFLSFWSSLEV